MNKVKVLYVEDEVFLAKIVCESLETRGYHVLSEGDGSKAVSLFVKEKPDVCVLDIMLPNKDGFEIADEIRSKDLKVPIIFLSARSQTVDVINGFKLGGNDYIRKPFSVEELIVRIENALKNKTQASEETEEVKVGAFMFNTKRQTLTIADDPRKLSYRESELLRILYANRDQILERKEILTFLWGSDSFFNSRNLDVYITKLRNYLRQDPSIEIITIKGIGYRFVCS